MRRTPNRSPHTHLASIRASRSLPSLIPKATLWQLGKLSPSILRRRPSCAAFLPMQAMQVMHTMQVTQAMPFWLS